MSEPESVVDAIDRARQLLAWIVGELERQNLSPAVVEDLEDMIANLSIVEVKL